MPFQSVPDTAEFRLVQELRGEDVLNLLYVRNTVAPWSTANLFTTAEAIGDAWRDNVLPELSSSLRLVSVDARDLEVEFGAQSQALYGDVGADITEELPANVAAWVKQTGDPGSPPRSGGLFIAGLTISDVASGGLDAAFVVALAAALEAVDAAIAAAQATNAQVIVSRYMPDPAGGSMLRPVGLTNTIGQLIFRTEVGSQRGRRPGQ